MSILSNYDSPEDFSISGAKDIEKFILANYSRYTVYQMTQLLGITPGVIQDVLSDSQLSQMGKKPAPSTIIVRDSAAFAEDIERFVTHGNR